MSEAKARVQRRIRGSKTLLDVVKLHARITPQEGGGMERRFFSIIGFVFCMVALIAICASLIHTISNEFTPDKKGDFATWVGAIGTVGTLIGTIWLATDKDRRERALAERKAYIVAVKIAIPLKNLISDLEKSEIKIWFATKLDDQWNYQRLCGEIESITTPDIATEDLAALVVLDGSHAFHLIRAIQLVEFFKRELKERNDMFVHPNILVTSEDVEWVKSKIKLIVNHLTVCGGFYQKFVDMHASPPTLEEMWDVWQTGYTNF
ncbi:hypothetical protein [Herbaspirillum camelliae]|uniref:hypothetical protein n=1 Tax=Herbaspirillum camelliae TaxID=1892903 RepID=UPI000949D7F5|nr:hypothetical protein [Herbaspirillum camelliae]